MAAKYYAIKSCVQGVLHDVSQEGHEKDIDIKFMNTFSTERSSDSVEARADGQKVITLETSVDYTFTLGMEVVTEPVLAMLMGGEYDGDVITVGKEAPATVYSLEGTFKLVGDDGSVKVKKMKIGKCKPVVDTTLDFSAIDLSTFELKFDILADEDGNYYTVEDNA